MGLRGTWGLGTISGVIALGALARPAHACGGGLVTTTELDPSVGDTQRVVMSMHDGVTDIVAQIGVPRTTADYGALLPEPSEPTLDPNPVSADDLEELDRETVPKVMLEGRSGDGGGCGCGAAEMAGSKGTPGAVAVSQPTDIGPVTAVVLSATDGSAVRTWLDENGFTIPAEDTALIDDYSGAGRYFIAVKRNQAAATDAPTSIGVHFRLPVAHAELPLRFARLGAAPKVAFTVFLFAEDTLVPAAPFEVATLDGLDADVLRTLGYASAVEDASHRNGGHGFVLEGSRQTLELGKAVENLELLLGASRTSKVTRLATVLERDELQEDAHFTEVFTDEVPNERVLSSNAGAAQASGALVGLALCVRRRRRRGDRSPAG